MEDTVVGISPAFGFICFEKFTFFLVLTQVYCSARTEVNKNNELNAQNI